MIAYASPADMVDRFGELELIQLTDTVNLPPSTIDESRVRVKLSDAQAFVEGYVGQVYRLPLTGCKKPDPQGGPPQYVAPPVLTRITCDLARYYLYDDLAPENEVYRRYKAAVKELEDIASGKALLACPWGGPPGSVLGADALSENDVHYEFSPRQITDETLKGFG